MPGFPRSLRLLTSAEYGRVFKHPTKSVDSNFTVLWRRNDLGCPRLGMAIAKKSLKRAVDRNRVKRIVRESFRQHQLKLSGFDIVVLSRHGLSIHDRVALRCALQHHWEKIGG